ncbi:hypothetical protein J7I86_11260 [Arthrobacter sp. ISL-95]|nr:hypothetical protein [Arthrobacter sp. ISL-95]
MCASFLAAALAAASLVFAMPAEAGSQVYNPCQRLSAGQVKFPSYGANRVTFATATDRSQSAVLITGCVRSGSGYVQEWQTTGFAGSKGFSAQNLAWEDSWKSPTGSFSFTEALGRSNPGTALKYYSVNPNSRWGGEHGPTYNQYFEGAGGESDENLWTYMNQGFYEQAAVINWNRYPDMPTVQGASFAIFFHAGNVPSAGCISTNLGTVTQLLKTNRPGDRIIMGAVDDVFTPYSSSPFGAITNKYAALGGPAFAGGPVSHEMYGLKNGGAGQAYQNGSIHWGGSTGVHISMGAIRAAWGATGFEKGYLGYPTTDEIPGMAQGGIGQAYEGGSIYFTPATGAHVSTGAIRSLWAKHGYEKGKLGYPTSDEYVSAGAVVQNYQGGIITWFGSSGSVVLKAG